jgi:hypothetical protein
VTAREFKDLLETIAAAWQRGDAHTANRKMELARIPVPLGPRWDEFVGVNRFRRSGMSQPRVTLRDVSAPRARKLLGGGAAALLVMPWPRPLRAAVRRAS